MVTGVKAETEGQEITDNKGEVGAIKKGQHWLS